MLNLTSRDNPKIKNIRNLLCDKKYRSAQNLFVCEGPVLLREALAAGVEITEIYTSGEHIQDAMEVPNAESYLLPPQLLQLISDVKTPQGIVFVCKQPPPGKLCAGSLLALENIRDSGNMGTILRTAEGLGVKNVVFLGNCAELYNPKTVRASMGSIFRLLPVPMELMALKEHCAALKLPLYATALSPTSVDIRHVSLKNAAVIIGNEAHGVSKEALCAADRSLIIPIETAQSFNASVAASIVLWEMVR